MLIQTHTVKAQSIFDQISELKHEVDTTINRPYKYSTNPPKPNQIFNTADAELRKRILDLIANVYDSISFSGSLQGVLQNGDTTNLDIIQKYLGHTTSTQHPYSHRFSDTSGLYWIQFAQTPSGSLPQGAIQFSRNSKTKSIYCPSITHNNQDTLADTSGIIAYTWQTRIIQTKRISTNTIPGGGTGLILITWDNSFKDNNYSAVVSVEDATASSSSLRVVHIEAKNLGQIVVRVENTSGGTLTGTIDAIGIHD